MRFPFTSFEANANWMMTVAMAADLVRWFQLLCLEGPWVGARPKALRWGLLHAPGRLIHRSRQRVVRIIDGWPGTDALLGAYRRIALITLSELASSLRVPTLTTRVPKSLPGHL